MMQLCASKARLRSSISPFSFAVQRPWEDSGLLLPRIVFWPFVAMRAEVPKPGICSFFLLPITPLNGKRGAEALQIVCAESWEHR